ncbi:TPA_asm: P [Rubus alphacytorhabdovirus 1]|nr:TPA_asm: P [Rubus alphacytorhabdovirus 1]
MGEPGEYGDLVSSLSPSYNVFSSGMDDNLDNLEDNHIPEPSLETVDDDYSNVDEGIPDLEPLKKSLVIACEEMGTVNTPELWNTVLASTSIYSVNEDSMRWMVLGMSYMNNQRIVPTMTDMIKELKTEIKALQKVNTSIISSSSDITKKMTSIRDDIIGSFSNLKNQVIDKFVAPTLEKAAKLQESSVVIQVAPPQCSSVEAINEIKSVKIPPPQSDRIEEKPEMSASSETSLFKEKLVYLKDAGLGKKYLGKECEDLHNVLLPDIDLAQLMFGEDEAVKESTMDRLVSNVAVFMLS